MKILVTDKINIDLFCKNPIQILETSNNGTIAVLQNNNPVFYAITPYCLKKIFDIEYNSVYKNIKQNDINKKFSMNETWIPDKNFLHQAALWGIFLTEEVSQSELTCFIAYWKAEGCFFHHVQWQQKLARSLEKSRSLNHILKNKRDITHIPTPDLTIPHGFRDK